MSEEQVNDGVRRFYGGVGPSAELSQRLVALARMTPSGPLARLRQSRLAAPLYCAAALAAAVGLFAAFRAGYSRGEFDAWRSLRPISIDLAPASEPSASRPFARPRLIVARVHADWCPRSPSIQPIYDELTAKYADEPILFVTLDITSPASRRQAVYLANALGLGDLLAQNIDKAFLRYRMEPGMIELIDTEAPAILAAVRVRDELPALEVALAKRLVR